MKGRLLHSWACWLFLAVVWRPTNGIDSTPTCATATEFFDTTTLRCQSCIASGTPSVATNKIPDTSTTDTSGNALSCKCNLKYFLPTPGATTCTACATDTFPVADGTRCIPCDTASGASASSSLGRCSCPTTHRLAELTVNATEAFHCVACPAGTTVFAATPYTCSACSDPHATYDGSQTCVCDSGYQASGELTVGDRRCITQAAATAAQAYSTASAATVSFSAVETASGGAVSSAGTRSSVYIAHDFTWAAATCLTQATPDSATACQSLANMCAMHLYSAASTPCTAFEAARNAKSGTVDQRAGWTTGMPWLRYTDSAAVVAQETGLRLNVAFDTASGTRDLQLRVAAFDRNGSFLGLQPFNHGLLYCMGGSLRANAALFDANAAPIWLQFGHSKTVTADCDLRSLLTASNTGTFFDLFIVDAGNDNALYPLPQRIENIAANAPSAATAGNTYTRRFALYDTAAGTASVSAGPSVVRYVDRAVLRVSIRDDDASRLQPPVLSLRYRERLASTVSAGGAGASARITLRVVYTMNTDGLWRTATGFLVAGLVLVLAVGFAAAFSRSRAAPAQEVTATDLFKGLLVLTTAFAKVFALILFLFTWFVFVFFKAQGSAFFLLPEDDPDPDVTNEYRPFYVMLVIVWVCQCIQVAKLLYRQCTVDVFFVDWEQPRGLLDPHDHVSDAHDAAEDAGSSKRGGGSSGRRRRDKGAVRRVPVSVWRTVLAANQWCDIQTVRQIDPGVVLIAVVFLLDGLGLRYLATPQPDGDLSEGDLNPALRFANTTMWWLIVAAAYRLWTWLVRDRFLTEPPHEMFIDMCTVAKVSVFVMDDDKHGYYLHCRSPHKHADGSMLELSENLAKEAQQQLTGRGLRLRGCPPDAQAFELFASALWRERYDSIYRIELRREMARQAQRDGRRASLLPTTASPAQTAQTAPAALIRASTALSKFLRGFVDQTAQNLPLTFSVRTFFAQVLDLPPDMLAPGTSTVLHDSGSTPNFTSTMFYGIERDLLLLDVLTFAVFDWWTGSSVSAALFVFLIQQGCVWVRDVYGKRNLAAKTLIDERFLV